MLVAVRVFLLIAGTKVSAVLVNSQNYLKSFDLHQCSNCLFCSKWNLTVGN